MTGSNLLQINSAKNLPVTAGGRDSLVEVDSDDSSATDIKLKLSSNDACDTGLILVNTRGTLLIVVVNYLLRFKANLQVMLQIRMLT
jgi:hypothetical protein